MRCEPKDNGFLYICVYIGREEILALNTCSLFRLYGCIQVHDGWYSSVDVDYHNIYIYTGWNFFSLSHVSGSVYKLYQSLWFDIFKFERINLSAKSSIKTRRMTMIKGLTFLRHSSRQDLSPRQFGEKRK